MFGMTQRGVQAYAKVGLETSVVAASPHELIVLLFDGALAAIHSARLHMKAGKIQEKGTSISRAIEIVNDGLRASLDKKAGGEIANSLDSLYMYMTERLLQANLKNSVDMLDEVHTLLADLRDAWASIGKTPAPAPATAASNAARVLASA
ncbi:flagellar export chaperone FliS [Massilia sp. LXY-6]|uniref:flagellar export chaperone FliS n=1 Tax=Massilia sp. LXY-6 TaxID=3379823 RepID=UPI003EE0DE57